MPEPLDPTDPAVPVSPAPHGAVAADHPAYRMSPVSFASRSGRMTVRQHRAWETERDRYVLSVPRSRTAMSVDRDIVLDPAAVFGRTAPLVVEIGSGQGEAIVAAATEHRDADFLAIEVYAPGLAQTIHRAIQRELTNLRLLQANAAEVLATTLPEGCADELWVFFPDPWHKNKHHKRRLVTAEFARVAARVLRPPVADRPGGTLRLATDWAEYADHMLHVLDAAEGLVNAHGPGGRAPRFDGRALTGFEKKAGAAGRAVTDLTYRRF